jgi:hypothetical protein
MHFADTFATGDILIAPVRFEKLQPGTAGCRLRARKRVFIRKVDVEIRPQRFSKIFVEQLDVVIDFGRDEFAEFVNAPEVFFGGAEQERQFFQIFLPDLS